MTNLMHALLYCAFGLLFVFKFYGSCIAILEVEAGEAQAGCACSHGRRSSGPGSGLQLSLVQGLSSV